MAKSTTFSFTIDLVSTEHFVFAVVVRNYRTSIRVSVWENLIQLSRLLNGSVNSCT